ncbi:MAG: chemotaxis protein CheC [Thermoanaerobacteraceae bacterium]|nr:chemotaxis protein CheC [Thermoanaerobacteraceae bacterium]
MTTSWDDLQTIHLSALQEIGNIGAGNAATALAQMLNTTINMSVPKSGVLPIEDMLKLVGKEEDIVACTYCQIMGDVKGSIFFLLTEESAYKLVRLLAGDAILDNQEMTMSALQEIGNILAGNFLTAFTQFTNLSLTQSVPALAFDMLGAVLSGALLEGGHWADKVLIIETEFFAQGDALNGHFFLVPTMDSLKKILNALGLEI